MERCRQHAQATRGNRYAKIASQGVVVIIGGFVFCEVCVKGARMLNIGFEREGEKLVVTLDGRLDTFTAPDLSNKLETALDGVPDLTFECAKLEYVSSAGLRVFLVSQKTMMRQGQMRLVHVSEEVMDILEVTGFVSILTIE